jgi:membrane-bound metal-dependent hydrolase YbcI (DUF457 family)
MIAGHFGLAAIVKSREPETPLWALMLATVWLDIVFVPLYLAHIETVEPLHGTGLVYGGSIIHADYTHSLVGAILLSGLLGAFAGRLWGSRNGIVVGLVSFSHWLLDLVVHHDDMPILPGALGNLPKLGFGLWQFPIASIIVELSLVLIGAWAYWRASRAVARDKGRGVVLAPAVSALIALFGMLVLFLDVTGLAG